jgi:hypothetical protein
MNPQDEIIALQKRVTELEDKLYQFYFPDIFRFSRGIQHKGLTLGFFSVTPVVQAGAITAPNTQGAVYNQADANTIVTAVNSLRTALKNVGITA